MANPLRISYLNRADSPGTLTASSAQASLPVTNLQTADVRILWRATSGSANVILDIGSVRGVAVVGLIRTNLTGSDTVRVRTSETSATVTTALSHDSGILTPAIDTDYKRFIYFIDPSGNQARYVRLDLVQSASCEAGRLFVSRTWTPSSNMQYGWGRTWLDLSNVTESIGQSRFVDIRGRRRGFTFRLTALTETEVTDEIEVINRVNGMSRDILVCRDRFATNLGRETLWGPLNTPIVVAQTRPLSYDAELTIYDRDQLP